MNAEDLMPWLLVFLVALIWYYGHALVSALNTSTTAIVEHIDFKINQIRDDAAPLGDAVDRIEHKFDVVTQAIWDIQTTMSANDRITESELLKTIKGDLENISAFVSVELSDFTDRLDSLESLLEKIASK